MENTNSQLNICKPVVECKPVVGYLEIIMGCMASGKSTEGLRRYRRYLQHKDKSEIAFINHADDVRYGEGCISTHDKTQVPCIGVSKLEEFYLEKWKSKYEKWKIIIIEEAQFFSDLLEFVKQAVDIDHKKVIIIGLDGDSNREVFGDLTKLIPLADNYQKLKAICNYCNDGTEAIFTKRLVETEGQKLVGTLDMYKPVCRYHYFKIM